MARKTRQQVQQYSASKLGSRYRAPTAPTYTSPYEDMKGRKKKRPQAHVVTLGETYPDIAEKYGVDPTTLMQGAENRVPIPGTTVPVYPETGLSVRPGYTPEPPPKVGLETADITPEGIAYPEGWNPAQVLASTEYGSMDFYSKFYGGYYTEYGGLGAEAPPAYSPTKTGRAWGGMPSDPRYGTPTEALPEIPGIPTYHAWTKDETTGAWERQEEGAVFDALYEINGIDPNDPDMVEWFWSFADEDLLGVGELFDVIDWGGGADGYGGGYGGPATYGLGTPSRMVGRGQQPVRGNYATYLGLTSWRI